jgi:hypothetical protein
MAILADTLCELGGIACGLGAVAPARRVTGSRHLLVPALSMQAMPTS